MRKSYLWCLLLVLTFALPAFAAQAPASKSSSSKQAPTSPVNLNTASETDLEALPGVGPATAKKIIAGRPYATIADLSKAGVPKNTIEKITPMVTVGAASPAAAAPVTPAAKPAPASAPAASAPATTAAKPAPASTSAPAATSGSSTPTAGAQQPPVKGMVWVNLSTKVYHKEGDRYYGNTKNGKFMTEDDAIKAGYRAAKTGGKSKTQ